jgi:hypothetical protein
MVHWVELFRQYLKDLVSKEIYFRVLPIVYHYLAISCISRYMAFTRLTFDNGDLSIVHGSYCIQTGYTLLLQLSTPFSLLSYHTKSVEMLPSGSPLENMSLEQWLQMHRQPQQRRGFPPLLPAAVGSNGGRQPQPQVFPMPGPAMAQLASFQDGHGQNFQRPRQFRSLMPAQELHGGQLYFMNTPPPPHQAHSHVYHIHGPDMSVSPVPQSQFHSDGRRASVYQTQQPTSSHGIGFDQIQFSASPQRTAYRPPQLSNGPWRGPVYTAAPAAHVDPSIHQRGSNQWWTYSAQGGPPLYPSEAPRGYEQGQIAPAVNSVQLPYPRSLYTAAAPLPPHPAPPVVAAASQRNPAIGPPLYIAGHDGFEVVEVEAEAATNRQIVQLGAHPENPIVLDDDSAVEEEADEAILELVDIESISSDGHASCSNSPEAPAAPVPAPTPDPRPIVRKPSLQIFDVASLRDRFLREDPRDYIVSRILPEAQDTDRIRLFVNSVAVEKSVWQIREQIRMGINPSLPEGCMRTAPVPVPVVGKKRRVSEDRPTQQRAKKPRRQKEEEMVRAAQAAASEAPGVEIEVEEEADDGWDIAAMDEFAEALGDNMTQEAASNNPHSERTEGNPGAATADASDGHENPPSHGAEDWDDVEVEVEVEVEAEDDDEDEAEDRRPFAQGLEIDWGHGNDERPSTFGDDDDEDSLFGDSDEHEQNGSPAIRGLASVWKTEHINKKAESIDEAASISGEGFEEFVFDDASVASEEREKS